MLKNIAKERSANPEQNADGLKMTNGGAEKFRNARSQLAVWRMIPAVPGKSGQGILEAAGIGREKDAKNLTRKNPAGALNLFIRLLIAEHVFHAGGMTERVARDLDTSVEKSAIGIPDKSFLRAMIRDLLDWVMRARASESLRM